jgi:hypothetical protein
MIYLLSIDASIKSFIIIALLCIANCSIDLYRKYIGTHTQKSNKAKVVSLFQSCFYTHSLRK